MLTAKGILWGLMVWCSPSLIVLAGLIWAKDIGIEKGRW